jgi:hypothetical protein
VSAEAQREARREEFASREALHHPQGSPPERTVLSATEARQGEVILGKYGIWIWIGCFAAILLLVLAVSFWP